MKSLPRFLLLSAVLSPCVTAEEQCIVLGCCVDDCCGEGTAWDAFSEYCVPAINATGFNGTHVYEYKDGCIERVCCEGGCCGDGTNYDINIQCCVPARGNTMQADFSNATPDNIVLLDSLHETGDDTVIEVLVNEDSQVFVTQGGDDLDVTHGGAACPPPPAGSTEQETNEGGIITIPLNGVDTIIYVCQSGVIVGRCIHIFESSQNYVSFNFAGAGVGNFVSFYRNFPSFGGAFAGINGCASCSIYFVWGAGVGGGGGGGSIGGSSGLAGEGDPCPPDDAESIPNDADFTLFQVEGDALIYACENGITVARCIITVGPTLQPSETPSTVAPTPQSSTLSPTIGQMLSLSGVPSSPPTILATSGVPMHAPSPVPTQFPTRTPSPAPTMLRLRPDPSSGPTKSPSLRPTPNPTSARTLGLPPVLALPTDPTELDPTSAPVKPCTTLNDCATMACAREEHGSLNTVCCESGAFVYTGYESNNVCTGLGVGKQCGNVDALCDTGLFCINGTCAAEQLIDNEPCGDDNDCTSGSCQREEYHSSNTVCCESGAFVYTGSVSYSVCTGLGVGKPCGNVDALCGTGLFCINGTCAAEQLEDNEPCGDDNDCKSGSCQREEYRSSNTVCCESGAFVYTGYVSYSVCTGLGIGKQCGNVDALCDTGFLCQDGICIPGQTGSGTPCALADDCPSGEACALEEFGSSNKVCCTSGHSVNGVCTDQDLGKACGNTNAVCKSGMFCINGNCMAAQLGPDQPCGDSNDCARSVCAREDFGSSNKVCCASGHSVENVCTDQDVGKECPNTNAICKSGLFCINGNCTAAQLGPDQPCGDSNDCARSVCAREDFGSSNMVCCASGHAVSGVCTNLDVGKACGSTVTSDHSNAICKSGLFCTNGICSAS